MELPISWILWSLLEAPQTSVLSWRVWGGCLRPLVVRDRLSFNFLTRGGGGVCQFMIFSDKGGEGG